MNSKAVLAALLFVIMWMWPGSAAEAWPIESKYFALDREVAVRDRGNRPTEKEAAELGSMMDQIHERYKAAGFPDPLLDKNLSGRWNVDLIHDPSVTYNGVYIRSPALGGIPGIFSDNESLIDNIIELNVYYYRKSGSGFAHTLAHEYFHAIQSSTNFGKAVFRADSKAKGELAIRRYDWITEGTADAAANYAANGIGGYSNSPSSRPEGSRAALAGLRSYAGPLHMDPPEIFPPFPGLDVVEGFKRSTYRTSSFWRFLAAESVGLRTLRLLLEPPVKEPIDSLSITQWVHDNIKALPLPSGTGKRFPGGLPQAYAEFIAEFSDLPFIRRYGHFFLRKANIFDEGVWHALVFGHTGSNRCTTIDLTSGQPKSTQVQSVQEFGSACFHLSLAGSSSTPPSAFEVNIVAELPGDETYVCQAVGIASNGAVIKATKRGSLTGAPQGCALTAPIIYAPRTDMTHQTVVITNVHAAGGNGSILGTRFVRVRAEFVMGSATASGSMSPTQQSSSAPPPPSPGAPAASPPGTSTGKNVSIKSTSARARGKQSQHATASQKSDCSQSPDFCPQIEIDLAQYDERFEAIAAMGDTLGAGALVALDGAPRQLDVIGIYGNPERLGAMAMEMAGSEFTEVSLRLRAPEGRIEKGMRWDDAVITALVGTMASDDNVGMNSRGPYPEPGACGSEPPATGTVEITDVGEGWISGTFSADLFERYVHEPGRDRCAARPANGTVSGTFTAPYSDITQPPVDPELSAYQAWAGLPSIAWTVTDYDDLVRQALATQRDLLRDWEAERGSPRGAGVGAPSLSTCSQQCVPGVLGCPDISPEEVERLTPLYLETLPAMARDTMRQQLERTSHEGRSRLLAMGMDVKGCMDATARP